MASSQAGTGPAVNVDTESALSVEFFGFFREFLVDRSAISLADSKAYLVESRMMPVIRQFDLGDFEGLHTALRGRPSADLEQAVVDAMTTNETSFFRDKHPFDALEKHLLPALKAARPADEPITIWCAASSSGQEPYSIAMLVAERFPQLGLPGNLRILATDLSPTMVHRCEEGRFSQFEVNRGLPATHLVKYFDQDGRSWQVKDELRAMIECRQLNLMHDWRTIPRADIVMIRNVLIYFTPEMKKDILVRIRKQVLRPDGYLLLGSAETTLNLDDGYGSVTFGRTIAYAPTEGHQ